MAGRVDQDDIAAPGAKANLRGVDGDALVALGLQRIEQERPFERHAASLAGRLERFELAVRQASGLVKQTTDQSRFAVVHMANYDHAELRAPRPRKRR